MVLKLLSNAVWNKFAKLINESSENIAIKLFIDSFKILSFFSMKEFISLFANFKYSSFSSLIVSVIFEPIVDILLSIYVLFFSEKSPFSKGSV